jgi:hypothetical protein
MTSKEQHERNLAVFVDLLKTSMSDVDSFRKTEISSYFLMMRKFFKDYVIENNKKYDAESPLHIKNKEADNIQRFFNAMIEVFDRSKGNGYIYGMTVLDEEMFEELREYQIRQSFDMEIILRQQAELVAANRNRMEELLRKV